MHVLSCKEINLFLVQTRITYTYTFRASLRRPRAHSTGRKEAKPKLEEEKNKDEEKQEEPPKDETAEVAEGGEEEATGGKVTIEVQVENGEWVAGSGLLLKCLVTCDGELYY